MLLRSIFIFVTKKLKYFLSQKHIKDVITNMNIRLIFVITILSTFSAYAQLFTLDDYLKKVVSQNLDYKIEQSRYKAQDAKSIGLQLPPPMIGLIQMKKDPNTTLNSVEIKQEIPFPTKLIGNYQARLAAASSQNLNRIIEQKKILLKARLLYIDMWVSQENLKLLNEKQKIIQEHLRLVKSTIRSDSTSALHLLKTESDHDLIENDILTSEQIFLEKQNELLIYINSDLNIERIQLSEPVLSPLPQSFSVTESPQYKSLQFDLDSSKSMEFEAKSMWLPDFEIKYRSTPASSMETASNELMLSASLPFLFFWQPVSEVKQAREQRLIAEYKLQNETRKLESLKSTLYQQAEKLKKQLDTLLEKTIPRSVKRYHMLHNLDYRDMDTLKDHREIMEAVPELKMQAFNLRLKYEKTIAEIESYITSKESQNE